MKTKGPKGIKKTATSEEVAGSILTSQPVQLALFRLTDTPFTNAFAFYESIPRFTVGGDRARYYSVDGEIKSVARNSDGTALPIEKAYEYQGKAYRLAIKPALIKQSGGGYKAVFPGIREEVIEFILFKLAIEKGFFTQTDQRKSASDNFTLFTTIYEIQSELKKRWGAKTNSLSNAQVREAISVLQESSLHLNCNEDKTDLHFQLISEF